MPNDGRRHLVLLLTGILLAGLFIPVETGQAQPQRFGTEHFTVADGLPDDRIIAMLEDRYGFLWIGTNNGLARYDGYDFTTYRTDPTDTTSLSHVFVSTLLEDRRGRLWVGTVAGLDHFDRGSGAFVHHRHDPDDPESLSDEWVLFGGLYEDREGFLWVFTAAGLDRLDPETGTVRRFGSDSAGPHGLSADPYDTGAVLAPVVAEDASGTLWIGTRGGGLNRFDRATERFTALRHDPEDEAGLSSDTITVVYEAPSEPGVLWLGTHDAGLDRLETATGRVRHFRHDPADSASLSHDFVIHVHEDRSGRLWVVTADHQLHRIDRATGVLTRELLSLPDEESRPAYAYHSFLEDRDGRLWMGIRSNNFWVHRRGYRFDPDSGTSFWYMEAGTPRSLLEDTAGIIWIGSGGYRGLFKFDPWRRHFRSYRPNSDDPASRPSSQGVQAFYDEPDGSLWVVGGDVVRLDREADVLLDPWRQDVGGNSVVGDKSGAMWIGEGYGLYRLDPQTGAVRIHRHTPDDPNSLTEGIVREVYVDESGILWIGTGTGLNRHDPETDTFIRYEHDPNDPSKLPASEVTAVLEDREGALWVGSRDERDAYLSRLDRRTGRFTISPPLPRSWGEPSASPDGSFWVPSNEGLYRYDPATGAVEAVFTLADGLPDNGVQGVLEDDMGRLWISTRDGLSRYDPKTGAYRNYDARDGLTSPRFFSAAHRLRTGEMAFGTNNGFILFDPSTFRESPHPPSVVLTELRLFNEPVRPGAESPLRDPIEEAGEIRLRHGQNDVTITYVGLHFRQSERIRYRYRLDGYERAWREAGSRREAVYPNLPPGHYVFHVTATSADGVESEEGASIRIVVLPPWWRTWWAYGLFTLLLLGAVVGAFHRQQARVVRREREQARAREAALRADKVEAENRALAAENKRRQAEAEKAHDLGVLNAALQAHKTQLETQNERLLALDQEKSRFFANLSHEFRTPLTLILGPLNDAVRHGGALVSEVVPMMRRSALRLQRLINQLLDLSRLEAGGMHLQARQEDLVPFLRNILTQFASRAHRQHIDLSFEAEEALPLFVDADKLEKVFFNLLSNAFKFTEAQGKIRVRIERTDTHAKITVRDTGFGIPPGAVPHVFDRFYQVDATSTRRYAGTGIGLALAKEIAELHGGHIDVESEVGFGSSFTVALPLGRAHLGEESIITSEEEVIAERLDVIASIEDDPLTGDEGTGPADETAALVLVVEDDRDMRAYLRGHLASGYRVLEAADGEEGLRLAREHLPDLVLSDVMMPKMDGFELCRRLKADEHLGHIPVILLTARAAEESKVEGLETGADAYLYKPFDAVELLLRVENLIELRRYLRARYGGESLLHPSPVAVPSADTAFLAQVKAAVEERLGDPNFNVDWLAGEVGISPRQLQRRLREAASLSAAGYIRIMRLERAAQLLEQKAGTVSEIAYRVGFKSARHFSQLFHQVFGVPPSEYVTRRDTDVSKRDTP